MEMIQTKNLDALTAEILIYKEQVGVGIIEIGKRLIEAKELVGHGNWENYLKEKVDFSQVTAYRFMKIALEIPNLSALKDMNKSKLFLLLDVPNEERETFIESKHIVNDTEKTVDEMTTRELQKVIQEKRQLENELSNKNNLISHLQNKPPEIKTVYKDNPETEISLQNKQRELQQKTQQLNELQGRLQKLQTLENKQSEIETTYKQIESLKKQRSEGLQQLNDEKQIFLFIERTSEFIKKEMLHIPTLITHYNQTETIKQRMTTITETLENFTFALKNKFKI